jgi:hypothetical protein
MDCVLELSSEPCAKSAATSALRSWPVYDIEQEPEVYRQRVRFAYPWGKEATSSL